MYFMYVYNKNSLVQQTYFLNHRILAHTDHKELDYL